MKATLTDIENDSIETLTEMPKPFDKVILPVGSRGNMDAGRTVIIGLDGVVKSMTTGKGVNIRHYVVVSIYDPRCQTSDDSSDLKPYTTIKHYADDYLRRPDLNYIAPYPGALTDAARSGKTEAAQYFKDKGEVPRGDVATVLKEVITFSHFNHQELRIISSDQNIKDALAQFENETD